MDNWGNRARDWLRLLFALGVFVLSPAVAWWRIRQ